MIGPERIELRGARMTPQARSNASSEFLPGTIECLHKIAELLSPPPFPTRVAPLSTAAHLDFSAYSAQAERPSEPIHPRDTVINRRACAFGPGGSVEAQEVPDVGPRVQRSVSPRDPEAASSEVPACAGIARRAAVAHRLARSHSCPLRSTSTSATRSRSTAVGRTPSIQTYTVTSSNPDIRATVATGQFVSMNVSHASSGAGDPAFSGTIVIQFFNDLVPNTATRSRGSSIRGSTIIRTSSGSPVDSPDSNGFIVQGGSPNNLNTGVSGLPGTPFANEIVQQLSFTDPGQIAMANTGAAQLQRYPVLHHERHPAGRQLEPDVQLHDLRPGRLGHGPRQ